MYSLRRKKKRTKKKIPLKKSKKDSYSRSSTIPLKLKEKPVPVVQGIEEQSSMIKENIKSFDINKKIYEIPRISEFFGQVIELVYWA